MGNRVSSHIPLIHASMGPRSSDRGYGFHTIEEKEMQLSFNGSTVLRPWLWPLPCADSPGHRASMGPRSSDRGYDVEPATVNFANNPLQWVHGPQTVVMSMAAADTPRHPVWASMGPRSSDRGYVRPSAHQ